MAELMTAAVTYAPGDTRVEQVPVPELTPGGLLVKVAACGVCGSDIPRMNFSGAHRHPIICGHEFSGHVVDAADDVEGFSIGDLVTVPPLLPCRRCESCAAGHFSLCEDYDYFGSRRDGAYAQYVLVPADNALVMPPGVDPKAAAMTDPSAIALHAIEKTGLSRGHRVAVLGAGGPIGLFAVQWAKILGASEVLAVDVDAQKAEMAQTAGATSAVIDPQELQKHASSYDVIIEAAGVPSTIAQTPHLAARRGHVVFIGIPHKAVELDKGTFSAFLRKELTWHGSWNSFSAPFPGDEWRRSAELMASGELQTDFMITHELGLEEVPQIMRQLADRSIFSSKVLFMPNR